MISLWNLVACVFLLGEACLENIKPVSVLFVFLLQKFLRCAPKSKVMAHMFSLNALPARGILSSAGNL